MTCYVIVIISVTVSVTMSVSATVSRALVCALGRMLLLQIFNDMFSLCSGGFVGDYSLLLFKQSHESYSTMSELNIAAASQWLEIKQAIRAETRIDPVMRYCAKTGRPIGKHDEQTFIDALEYCEPEGIAIALRNPVMQCAPQWIFTDSENLDALSYYDTTGFIIYVLAQFTRAYYEAPIVSRANLADKAIELYWSKARAFEIISKIEPQAQTALANELMKGIGLQQQTCAAIAKRLPSDCKAPDTLAKAARLGALVPVIHKAIERTACDGEATLAAIRNGPSNLLKTEIGRKAQHRTEMELQFSHALNTMFDPRRAKQRDDIAQDLYTRFAIQPISDEALASFDPASEFGNFEIDLGDVDLTTDEPIMRRMTHEEYMRQAQEKLASHEAKERAKRDEAMSKPGLSILARKYPSEPMARAESIVPGKPNSILNRIK